MPRLRVLASMAALVAAPAAAHLKPGEAAPAYSLTLADGARVPSSALKGEVVVLSLWATWCAPCLTELPQLDAVQRAHRAEGLRVFAVLAQDHPSAAKLAPIVARLAMPVARRLSPGRFDPIQGVPTNYVIDRHGIVRYAATGALDGAALDRIVSPLLAEK